MRVQASLFVPTLRPALQADFSHFLASGGQASSATGLPLLERQWTFQLSQFFAAQGSVLATARRLMRLVKDAFLGAGSWTDSFNSPTASAGNWTVVGSSDSVTAALDGADRWDADTDLVWAIAGVAHSWIVLQQDGILGTGAVGRMQVCLDLSNATASNATLVVSWGAGFTGGTTTARPTATDEFVFIGNTSWGMSVADADQRFHTLKSVDGKDTRVLITRNGQPAAFWIFHLPVNTVSGWTNPALVQTIAVNTTAPATPVNDFATCFGSNTTGGRGGIAFTGMHTCEGVRVAAVLLAERQTVPNDFNARRPFFPIGFYSNTATQIGRHGVFADLWTSEAVPRTYPADGTQQFIQVGAHVFPWNRSAPDFGGAAPTAVDAYLVTR